MKEIKKFFETYNFTEEERKAISCYNGIEVEMLYNCYINTDLEPTDENLYAIFRANFFNDEEGE